MIRPFLGRPAIRAFPGRPAILLFLGSGHAGQALLPSPAGAWPPDPPPPPHGGAGGRLRSAAGVSSRSCHRRAKPPEGPEPARARQSASGATSTAPDKRGEALPPPPPLRPCAAAWLPPPAFLPQGMTTPEPLSWVHWDSSRGDAASAAGLLISGGRGGAVGHAGDARRSPCGASGEHRPDALAAAMRAQLAVLASDPEFLPWVRDN